MSPNGYTFLSVGAVWVHFFVSEMDTYPSLSHLASTRSHRRASIGAGLRDSGLIYLIRLKIYIYRGVSLCVRSFLALGF